jgi:hypothetical protein
MVREDQRLRYGSYDLTQEDDPDYEVFTDKLQRSLTRRANLIQSLERTEGPKALYEQYNKLLSNGLSHAGASIATYGRFIPIDKMPYVKTGKRVPKGTNAKLRANVAASKAAKATKRGGYGTSSIDWNQVSKLADAAANKIINKNIETQYSQALVRMTAIDSVTATTGWDLQGLNWTSATANPTRSQVLNSAMIFNLGYLSQTGQSNLPGYRNGQRINAKALSITVEATLPQVSTDCTYHWRIVRRRNDSAGNSAYATPTIVSMDTVGLFKPTTDGPLASTITYPGYGQSSTSPIPGHVSSMRQNTDAWTFCTGAHGYHTVQGMPLDGTSPPQRRAATFCKKTYFALDQEWDFVVPNGKDIKGGNYFVILWREGSIDYATSALWSDTTSTTLHESINVFMELSFKDG